MFLSIFPMIFMKGGLALNNVTPVGLFQSNIKNRERCINYKRCFLCIFQLSELLIFWLSLFHGITAEEKKIFLKKLFFALNKGLLILELQVLTEIEIKLNRYFGKTTQFLVPFSFFIGFQAQLIVQLVYRCFSCSVRYSQC